MMKTNLFTMAVCITTMTLATVSCKKNSEQGGGSEVRSVAIASINTVAPSAKTEYEDKENSLEVTWSSTDRFTAYDSKTSGSSAVYSTSNGSGQQASFEGLWKQKPSEGSMLYAAYLGGINVTPANYMAIPIDLTGQTGLIKDLKNKDYMQAKAPYKSTGATQLAFNHRVAVVKLVLTFPEGVTGNATNVGLKATGLNYKAELDLTADNHEEYYKNKIAGDVNTGANAIAIDGTNRTITAYLCILPEALSNIKVTATVGSNIYEATVENNTLKAGMMYTFTKTMQKQWGATFAFTINPTDKTYTLPFTIMGATGNYSLTVNWGDNSSNTTIAPGTSLETPITHNYTTAGLFQITITSSETDFTKPQMPEFKPGLYWINTEENSAQAKLTSIDSPLLNMGITDLSSCLSKCTSLTSIPSELFNNNRQVTDFNSCFASCIGLSSIPKGLFDNNTAVTSFQQCFFLCVKLTEIPAGLFDNNTAVTSFQQCFQNCIALTKIPARLFDNNTQVTDFGSCFHACASLSEIPAGLFDNNTKVTDFSFCFFTCFVLHEIPAGLFDNNTAVTDFHVCFCNCGITSIPQGLFDKNTEVTNFSTCFGNCTNLTTVPEGLFSKNLKVTDFNTCFYSCQNLVLNSNIFCNEATESKTRFSKATEQINFSGSFADCGTDVSVTDGGTAPALWNYTFSNGVKSSRCYYDVDKVSNVADIPDAWK